MFCSNERFNLRRQVLFAPLDGQNCRGQVLRIVLLANDAANPEAPDRVKLFSIIQYGVHDEPKAGPVFA